MKWYKPRIDLSAKGMTVVLLIAGLAMLGLGIKFTFDTRGFEKTEAMITRIEVESEGGDDSSYTTYVDYEIDGKSYTGSIGFYQDGYRPGKRISIKYDPADPTRIAEDSPGMLIYLTGAGALLAAGSLYSLLRAKRKLAKLKEQSGADEALFGPRRAGGERELYFLTDLGTAKGGCHIEDPDRRVLYEADATDFSLISDSEYTFTDHENGRSRKFLVSKTVTSSSDAPWVLDSHSTFSLNGEDVWKSLHENGIEIETGLSGLKWSYEIYRDGVQVAHIESSGRLVHEEDAEKGGMLSSVPSQGFFRIWTDEKDLSAVFLCCFAIGRTDMMIYS